MNLLSRNKICDVEERLEEFGYDFDNFAIDRFIRWMENHKERKIVLAPWPMPRSLFGAWVSEVDGPHEWVFYSQDLEVAHRDHTIKHEFGHIILEHSTLRVSLAELSAMIAKGIPLFNQTLLRSTKRSGTEEEEAEAVAFSIESRETDNSERLTRVIPQVDPHKLQIWKSLAID